MATPFFLMEVFVFFAMLTSISSSEELSSEDDASFLAFFAFGVVAGLLTDSFFFVFSVSSLWV